MKKLICLLLLTTLLAGCASTLRYSGEGNGYSGTEEQYKLEARLDRYVKPGFFSSKIKHNVYLYINDVLAIRGPLHQDQSGQLLGAYQAKPVTLDCVKPNFLSATQCLVQIDGRRIDTLTLKLGR